MNKKNVMILLFVFVLMLSMWVHTVRADMRLILVNPNFAGEPVHLKIKEFKTMGNLCQKFLKMNNWHALLIGFDDFGNIKEVKVSYNKGMAT